ncbi:MAG TPA: archease [Dissulfurispiraceae bacterium]
MDFEVIDISGDVGLKAYGKSAAEAFVNAGLGMYDLVTDVREIREAREIELEVAGDSPEGLLVNYLNELIFHFDTYHFIGRRIHVDTFCLYPVAAVRGKVYGEEFDPERHEKRLLIKAATYHRIKVKELGGKWEIEVIFDI